MTPSDATPLVDALAVAELQPLWDRYMHLMTREPAPIDAPMAWSWQAMQPLIERAAAEIGMEHAERRVLLFSHPAFAPHPYATTNLTAGLQILQPGEHAAAHRHTVSALRFVIEGEGAVTWVDGKPCPMADGDLVLTPAWTWHEHRNPGHRRVVWFDGLDVPLAHHLRTIFLEFGGDPTPTPIDDAVLRAGMAPEPPPDIDRGVSPRYRYAAADTEAALAALPAATDGVRCLRYLNPLNGGAVMPTLDCFALRPGVGAWSRASRTTSNAVAVAARGSGTSRVGEHTFAWRKGDVFTLPHWHWTSHRADTTDGHLFLMTDRALLAATGYLRTEYE